MTQPKQHIHSALILEKARQDATGETAAGWWKWEIKHKTAGWDVIPDPQFRHNDAEYRCSMTAQHPQYVPAKPSLRLVDLSKLPVGTKMKADSGSTYKIVVSGVPEVHGSGTMRLLLESDNKRPGVFFWGETLRIAEQKDFTYWDGGDCPVPEGLMIECVRRAGTKFIATSGRTGGFWNHRLDDRDIIGYRIIGVDDGWTDNPSEATHDK